MFREYQRRMLARILSLCIFNYFGRIFVKFRPNFNSFFAESMTSLIKKLKICVSLVNVTEIDIVLSKFDRHFFQFQNFFYHFPSLQLWMVFGGWWVHCAVRRRHSKEGVWDTGAGHLAKTVESNIRVIHEQVKCSSWTTEANITFCHLAAKLCRFTLMSFAQMSLCANVTQPVNGTARFCIFIDYRGHHRKSVDIYNAT